MSLRIDAPGRRGACVLDADRILLEHPGIDATLDALGHAPTLGPLDARGAHEVTSLLAGTPVATLEKVGHHLPFRPDAVATVRAVRRAGFAVFLVGSAFAPTMEILKDRLHADLAAGLGAEVRYGRLTGRLGHHAWRGACGREVCAAAAAQVMRRDAPGQLVTVASGDVDPCLAAIARTVPLDSVEALDDPWLAAR